MKLPIKANFVNEVLRNHTKSGEFCSWKQLVVEAKMLIFVLN